MAGQQAVRMMSAAEWQASVTVWQAAGVPDEAIDAMSIGCPSHGNALTDWDPDGQAAFCYGCDAQEACRP